MKYTGGEDMHPEKILSSRGQNLDIFDFQYYKTENLERGGKTLMSILL